MDDEGKAIPSMDGARLVMDKAEARISMKRAHSTRVGNLEGEHGLKTLLEIRTQPMRVKGMLRMHVDNKADASIHSPD